MTILAKQIKRRKLKKSVIFKGFWFLFFLISLIAFFLGNRIGILPIKYLSIIGIVLILFNLFLLYLVSSKKWNRRFLGCFLSVIFSIILIIGIFYESITLGFFKNAFQNRDYYENYQVLVLNTSSYESLNEFKTGKIGVPNTMFSEGAKELQNEVKKRTSLTLEEKDNSSLVTSLLNKNLRVIVMEEAQKNIFSEINEDFKNQVKVIETISIQVKNEKKKIVEGELTKKPFHIYVSGNDDYGTINQVSRSDVNMIITVNPLTKQILLTSIPRDYYVSLEGMDHAKDKLTHASLYGIDTSMKTLEKLFGIDIDYYLKINFSSLVNLVEAVGGIDISNDEEFVAHYFDEPLKEYVTYHFPLGNIHLNGKEALAYSRERKSFLTGDRKRVVHQQMVLSALIQKVTSPSVLTSYPKILNALDGSFDTNVDIQDIISFIQKQIDSNDSWNVSSQVLEGTDGSEYVYSMSGYKTYVMIPLEESIESAKVKLKETFGSNS